MSKQQTSNNNQKLFSNYGTILRNKLTNTHILQMITVLLRNRASSFESVRHDESILSSKSDTEPDNEEVQRKPLLESLISEKGLHYPCRPHSRTNAKTTCRSHKSRRPEVHRVRLCLYLHAHIPSLRLPFIDHLRIYIRLRIPLICSRHYGATLYRRRDTSRQTNPSAMRLPRTP